jgi:hypothetical protein
MTVYFAASQKLALSTPPRSVHGGGVDGRGGAGAACAAIHNLIFLPLQLVG